MQKLNEVVPYSERCIRTDIGTAVVWPFFNAEKGTGPYELFLDNNALNDVKWFAQLPDEIRKKCVINPWPAIQEQWLSNPQFRESATDRINSMIAPLAEMGAKFRAQFAEEQEILLRKNEAALRTQFSLIVPYVVIMKTLLTQKLSSEQILQHLETLSQIDIPRFTSAFMLTALGSLLKENQNLKLTDDPKPAFSYISSFLAFQPGKKDETDHINVPYLRNRAGDLNLWLCLPQLRMHGYCFEGSPAIVTGDRALYRLIVRVIPPDLRANPGMGFTLLPEGLPMSLCKRIADLTVQIRIRANSTTADQFNRVANLFNLAKSYCTDAREQQALDLIYFEWWHPGSGKTIEMS